ncbi:MAG: type II toxin-antitoxin system RelB/DinJ family antitoxin [Gammaproteobacteria bacterium]
MDHKTAIVNARIEPKLKAQAERILQDTGLSPASAIRVFYQHICLHKGLPFLVGVPNNSKERKILEDALLTEFD